MYVPRSARHGINGCCSLTVLNRIIAAEIRIVKSKNQGMSIFEDDAQQIGTTTLWDTDTLASCVRTSLMIKASSKKETKNFKVNLS